MYYNDLDLNLIKTFLTVYECKSILLASKKLYISQPAVTKSIKRLEDFLGGKLFIRTPKGVTPTIECKEFKKACYNCVNALENGLNRFFELSKLNTGYLNIGSSSTIIRKILLPFIEIFNKKYPKIVISITDANSEKLVNYLKSGSIDLAIVNMPILLDNNFYSYPITQTHDCFIASKKFNKDYLTLKELKQEKLILQKKPSSNRDYFELMCIENKIQLNPKFEIESFGLITDFVGKNIGIGYTIKEFIEDDILNNRVKIINTDLKIKPRDICLLMQDTVVNNFVSSVFKNELIAYFKEKNKK